MALEFRVLGPLEAVRGDSAVRLGGRKQRSLLAAFVLHAGEFLSSDRLIDELWRGDDGGATARLQVHVSQLRKALGTDGELVETRPGGYVLAAPADAVDAHRFERLAASGRVALAGGDARLASRTIRSALDLWRGPALGDLAYEPVGERDAARLEEIRLVSREDLVDAELALGRHREVVGELERLVADHPLRERLRAQLMLALYRSGRQVDALDAYAAVREELAEQGLEPGPELEALQVAILRQDPALLVEVPEQPRVQVTTAAPIAEARGPALIERDDFLDTLGAYLAEAATGRGVLVFLGGEAGVGKTTLVERFAEQRRGSARILTGACEGATTPRPLGPLFDMLPGLRERWAGPASDASREELFEGLLEDLAGGPAPTVLLIEDVHWADEATLDLLRFLGRRLSRLPALVLATYRDDEVGRNHPLTLVLGDVATLPSTRRMALPRLSERGVTALAAGADLDPGALYRSTGGNAFFVTEVLASAPDAPGDEVPATVRDAVLARAARLSPAARRALDAASVVGFRVEPWLLERLVEGDGDAVDECVERGMLRTDGTVLIFRHELARRAVEDHVPAVRRVGLHRAILAALEERGAGEDEAARLAHHAEAAGDGPAVLRHAMAAGLRAARLGAHRDAVQQYERARRFAGGLSEEDRADLDERLSMECYVTDRIREGIDARLAALAVRRRLGQPVKVGEDLRWLSRMSWYDGRNADAEEYATEAVRVLEELPPDRELAYAYSNVSQLRMLAQRVPESVEWGERAIELAERLGEVEVLAHALNNVGTSLLYAERTDEGRAFLDRSLEIARRYELDHHVSRAHANLTSGYVTLRMFAEADALFGPALAYCEARDLDALRSYIEGWQAASHLEQGRWDAALAVARASLRSPQVSPVSRVTSLIVIGLVGARRGTHDPWGPLDEAAALAQSTGELQRLSPLAVARAEAAWLEGDLARETPLVASVFPLAQERGTSWNLGALAFWLFRAGELDEPPARIAEPYALQIRGRWTEAAALWNEIGCPYERAIALAEAGDEPSVRTALEILEGLGATRTIERLRT